MILTLLQTIFSCLPTHFRLLLRKQSNSFIRVRQSTCWLKELIITKPNNSLQTNPVRNSEKSSNLYNQFYTLIRNDASSRNPEVDSEESAHPQPRIRHPESCWHSLLYSHAFRRWIDVPGTEPGSNGNLIPVDEAFGFWPLIGSFTRVSLSGKRFCMEEYICRHFPVQDLWPVQCSLLISQSSRYRNLWRNCSSPWDTTWQWTGPRRAKKCRWPSTVMASRTSALSSSTCSSPSSCTLYSR